VELRRPTVFAIQKRGRPKLFRPPRRPPPRTYRLLFPEPMRRGRVASVLTYETSGSLQARFVSLVAAGNVNSGQLAIWGSDPLSASCSGGLTPILASGRRLRRLHLGLGRGSEALLSYGGRHLSCVCGLLASATIRQQAFGGKPRWVTAREKA
jgi:hypothetical protein